MGSKAARGMCTDFLRGFSTFRNSKYITVFKRVMLRVLFGVCRVPCLRTNLGIIIQSTSFKGYWAFREALCPLNVGWE